MQSPTPEAVASTDVRRGGRSGRSRNAGRGGGRGSGRNETSRSSFKGNTEQMNGHVFECYDEQTDRRQYSKTLEALQEYCKKHLKFAEDLAPLFAVDMYSPVIETPIDLPIEPVPTRVQEALFTESIKEYMKRTQALRSNLPAVFAVAWGQCSDKMQTKIKAHNEYNQRSTSSDCCWLLQTIKAITHEFDERINGFLSLLNARTSFLTCRQGQGQNTEVYIKH